MAITFNTIQELQQYINQYIKTNGNGEITGEMENNVENGLAAFIIQSILNNSKAKIYSTAGANVEATSAFNIFINQPPASLTWNNDVWYNEYYFVNMTGFPIPLGGDYVYYDSYGDPLDEIPARSVVHIAKAQNDMWVSVTNPSSGGGGSLPPQSGHEGEMLTTNGASASWISPVFHVTSANFEDDGVTFLDDRIVGGVYLYLDSISRILYPDEYEIQESPSGVKILLDGFDASLSDYFLLVFLTGKNS